MKLRVPRRDHQPFLEHLAARRQLLVELHHAAGDVEHDAGLPLVDSDNATVAPSPPQNSSYSPSAATKLDLP